MSHKRIASRVSSLAQHLRHSAVVHHGRNGRSQVCYDDVCDVSWALYNPLMPSCCLLPHFFCFILLSYNFLTPAHRSYTPFRQSDRTGLSLKRAVRHYNHPCAMGADHG